MYINMLYVPLQLSKPMESKQKNYRLPKLTLKQIAELREQTGMTETQVIINAIDRMARDILNMPENIKTDDKIIIKQEDEP
jgi:leucyl aminopeptidase